MNARMLCFTMLKEICLQKRYSNLVLRNDLQKAPVKDRSLITQIVYGSLQNYRYVRYLWVPYVKQLPDDEVCVLLDMSVYQLLFMDKVPSYAIINDAVTIAKKAINQRYGNLVNAVLRKVDTNDARLVTGSEEEQLAIQTSHPDWLIAMWKAQYGFDITKRICESDMEIKPNAVRVNTLRTSKEALLKEDVFIDASISRDALLYQGEQLIQSTYYQEGLISIQDEASQLVAFLLDPQKGETILDACSAPGTKACHMAQLMHNEGMIYCGDIHEHRVKLIEEGTQRLGITCMQAVCLDATKLETFQEASFDRVLCDVPCSGYGVLANKSDIKYHMQSSDMDTLIPLQEAILHRCSQMVKRDGILVYSTCTLNKKENEKQIAKFLSTHEEFTLIEQHTIFPYEYHCDGFYMAKLQKR